MFVSLHQPVTKKQKTKNFVLIFVVVVAIQKEKSPDCLFFFGIAKATKPKTKKFGAWFLVFWFW